MDNLACSGMDNALGTAPICRRICDDQSMFPAAFNAAQNTPAAPIIFYVQDNPHTGGGRRPPALHFTPVFYVAWPDMSGGGGA